MSVEAVDRKSGRVWRVRWRDDDGRARSKVLGRKADADLFDADLTRRKRMGTLAELDIGQQTLREFAEEWWQRYASVNLALRTRDKYAGMYDRHVLPYLGHLRLREITPDVLDGWVTELRGGGLGDPTIKRVLDMLSGMLGHAVRWGHAAQNPVELITKPRIIRAYNPRILRAEQVEMLRDAARRPVDSFVIGALAYGGFRPSELMALTWEDISDTHVSVTKAIDQDGTTKATKTAWPRRVRIRGPLRDVLAEWAAYGREGWVLKRPGGEPWDDKTWHTWHRDGWRPALEESGLMLRPYDLRHTFVSTLIDEGKSVVAVAAESGHSARTCLDTYAHAFEDHGEAA